MRNAGESIINYFSSSHSLFSSLLWGVKHSTELRRETCLHPCIPSLKNTISNLDTFLTSSSSREFPNAAGICNGPELMGVYMYNFHLPWSKKAKWNPKVRGTIKQIFSTRIYTPMREESWVSAKDSNLGVTEGSGGSLHSSNGLLVR